MTGFGCLWRCVGKLEDLEGAAEKVTATAGGRAGATAKFSESKVLVQ